MKKLLRTLVGRRGRSRAVSPRSSVAHRVARMYARGAPPTAVMRYLERQADKGSEEAEYMLRQYLDAMVRNSRSIEHIRDIGML